MIIYIHMIYACMGYIYIITTQLEEIQVLLQITSALVGSFAWCRNLQPESFLELLTSVFITNFMRESKSTIFMTVFCFTSFFHAWHHTTFFFLKTLVSKESRCPALLHSRWIVPLPLPRAIQVPQGKLLRPGICWKRWGTVLRWIRTSELSSFFF